MRLVISSFVLEYLLRYTDTRPRSWYPPKWGVALWRGRMYRLPVSPEPIFVRMGAHRSGEAVA